MGADAGDHDDDRPSVRVEDRRHWARVREEQEGDDDSPAGEPEPSWSREGVLEEYRARAEQAEARVRESAAALARWRAEQEDLRARLARDVDRKVGIRFADLVRDLVGVVDDLDLALDHMRQSPEAAALAEGVALARRRFLAALERHGVEPITPDGEPFDPESAEATRIDPVDDPDLDGAVTETVRPGYRLGDHLIRAAIVAVGRRQA